MRSIAAHPSGRAVARRGAGGSGEWSRGASFAALGSRQDRGSLGARGPPAGVHRGVYAVGHRALRPEGHRLAAVLACGPGAVLSHRSAAAHWGLLEHRPDSASTSPRPRPPRRPGDPPAPLAFPRCPGHHQPRRHPDHDGQPHPARSRRHRTAQRARARARAGRAPAALRPPRDRQTSSPDATGTAEPASSQQATSHEPKWTRRTNGKPRSWSCPQRRPPRAAATSLPRPRPRPVRARLPLARAPRHRRDRRLGDPRHPGRLQQTTAPRTPR